MLGLCQQFKPTFLKRYAQLGDLIQDAVQRYADDVRQGRFPAPEHCFKLKNANKPLPLPQKKR